MHGMTGERDTGSVYSLMIDKDAVLFSPVGYKYKRGLSCQSENKAVHLKFRKKEKQMSCLLCQLLTSPSFWACVPPACASCAAYRLSVKTKTEQPVTQSPPLKAHNAHFNQYCTIYFSTEVNSLDKIMRDY